MRSPGLGLALTGAVLLASLIAPHLLVRLGAAGAGDQGVRALEAGALEEAALLFTRAAEGTLDPDVRFRALHGLALVRLLQAREAPSGLVPDLARASVDAGREALRLEPSAEGTRRNLLLAQRMVPSRVSAPEGSSAMESTGGPGEDGPDAGSSSSAGTAGRPVSSITHGSTGGGGGPPEWSRARAEALLDALASMEGVSARIDLQRALGASASSADDVSPDRRYRGRPW